MQQKIREIKFNGKTIKLLYRDDSDQSVIDEFFVDKMYKSIDSILSTINFPLLDIGAHIGVFSLFSYIINPTTHIIALEPEPNNFKLLKANLKLNGCKNVKAIQTALITGKESKTALYLSKNTHNHSTLRPGSLRGDSVEPGQAIQVPAINLEQLMKKHKIKKIGILKMDIEGAEFDIIKALKHKNIKAIENMVIEYHESTKNKHLELETLIRSYGFSVEHFPNKFDKKLGLLIARNKRK